MDNLNNIIQLTTIGIVKSPVKDMIDENWGQIVAEIVIKTDYAAGLTGLEQFSHALIVFHMHQAQFVSDKHLRRHPRGCADFPLTGIFAQRAKHRPNPIGITAVQILDVAGDIMQVKGLDAVDGTPVLDIKPYVPKFDVRNVDRIGWLENVSIEVGKTHDDGRFAKWFF